MSVIVTTAPWDVARAHARQRGEDAADVAAGDWADRELGGSNSTATYDAAARWQTALEHSDPLYLDHLPHAYLGTADVLALYAHCHINPADDPLGTIITAYRKGFVAQLNREVRRYLAEVLG